MINFILKSGRGFFSSVSVFFAWSTLFNATSYFFYALVYEFRYLYPPITLSFFFNYNVMASFKEGGYDFYGEISQV